MSPEQARVIRRGRPRMRSALTVGLTVLAACAAFLLVDTIGTPAAHSATQFSLDWSMPPRYGDRDRNGLADRVYPPDGRSVIAPRGWRVDLTVGGAGCSGSTSRTWWIEGTRIAVGNPRLLSPTAVGCALSYRFPAEGVYEVAFEERDQSGKLLGQVKKAVTVQDFLIVSIGDSVASGEGNPETPATSSSRPKWENGSRAAVECHRSRYAGPAQAALAIENETQHTSVTFVHLACSGATIVEGLLGSQLPPRGAVRNPQPPQLAQLRTLLRKREIDALTISIGANDVRFSELVRACMRYRDCNIPASRSRATLFDPEDSAATLFRDRVATLPGLYDKLARALKDRDVRAKRVSLTQYYDPTHYPTYDKRRKRKIFKICQPPNMILADHPDARKYPDKWVRITAPEATWASEKMLVGINSAGQNAVKKHEWHSVSVPDFIGHGYCAANPWVVKYTESVRDQLDEDGTLHPNHAGQKYYGRRIAAELRPGLGAGRLVRRPFQRLRLEGSGPADPGFGDVVGPVEHGATVQLRVTLNGKPAARTKVSYAVGGSGALSAWAGVTDLRGVASLTFTAAGSSTCRDSPVCATVTATVIDEGRPHSDSLTVGIIPRKLTITPPELDPGIPGAPYSQTLQATGGTGPLYWSVAELLPPGLTLDSVKGVIEGTPAFVYGESKFTINARDDSGNSGTQEYTLIIGPPPCIGSPCAVAVGSGHVVVSWTRCGCAIYPLGPYEYLLQNYINGVWGVPPLFLPFYLGLYGPEWDASSPKFGPSGRVWHTYGLNFGQVVGDTMYFKVNYADASVPKPPQWEPISLGTSNTVVVR